MVDGGNDINSKPVACSFLLICLYHLVRFSQEDTESIDWGTVGSFEKWGVLCVEISCHLSNLYSLVYKR